MMKKWILAAVGYLLVVIAGYSIYTSFFSQDIEKSSDGHAHESSSDAHGEHDGHGGVTESEVNVEIDVIENQLQIELTDHEDQPVEELEINHEKLLHLIIVDEHLDQYYHLHPEEEEPGVYMVQHELEQGNYKAFVDIKPKGLAYVVEPLEFTIDETGEGHHHGSLEVDQEMEKTINGVTAKIELSSMKANEDITITYTFPNDIELQPYLGALGHVVILNETATNYIHVHPLNHDETRFETMFPEPGIYKVWGEFQIDGEVHIYPFTLSIE
ncbi:hypothetical protein [Bacillus sp. AK128]